MSFTESHVILNEGFPYYEQVWRTEKEHLWDEIVEEHHYLGARSMSGHRLKYLIWYQDKIAGAISWSAGAQNLRVRDCYIGWSKEQLKTHRHRILNNSRFLILPWAQKKNFASFVLSRNIRSLSKDWVEYFGYSPWLLETFVDGSKFSGTIYKASNWTHIGQTSGFGKAHNFLFHGNIKEVFVYKLNQKLREKIGCSPKEYDPLYCPPQWIHQQEKTKMIIRGKGWTPDAKNLEGFDESALDNIGEELIEFHKLFEDCYHRKGTDQLGLTYLGGLLSDLPRKSIEPMALRMSDGKKVRGMQRFMKSYRWDEEKMMDRHRAMLMQEIGDENGMITLDSSEFLKKGYESVGVARQYCGRAGKVDSCQCGVFIGYSSEKGYGLLAHQLYMPECWFDDDYAERRDFNLVPKDLTFMKKTKIASELINQVTTSQNIPARWVGCDSTFGMDREFLEALPEDLYYFASVRSDLQVFTSKPEFEIPPYSGRGPKPKHPKVTSGHTPIRLSELVESGMTWEPVVLGEGAKGPILTQLGFRRVQISKNGLPIGDKIWLIVRKNADGSLQFAISNAPKDTTHLELAKVSTMRWPIEQCFGDGKGYLGMSQYEHRSWVAWNRHMTMVTLGLHLLLRMRLKFQKKLQT